MTCIGKAITLNKATACTSAGGSSAPVSTLRVPTAMIRIMASCGSSANAESIDS